MDLPATGFDWDHGNIEKYRRHGVSVADIEGMFHRLLWLIPDPAHSAGERRFKAVGTNANGRHIFVAFTLRRRAAGVLVRPISARYMHKKEVRHYEKQKAEAEKISGLQD